MFPEAYDGASATSPAATELAAFLRDEADAIGKASARLLAGGLPLIGAGARRRLRGTVIDQVRELSRHLDNYGTEGPRLYGESQRRYAAARLAEGVDLHDALEERAVVHDVILSTWEAHRGPIPAGVARLLAQSFSEVGSQMAEVWITYQRAEGVAFQEAALLDTIVHSLDEAILVVEPDGTISYATPALEQIVGIPSRFFVGVGAERLGALLQQLELRDREGNPFPREKLPHRIALLTREAQHEDFVRIRRMDGTESVVEMYAAPVFAEEGELRGAIFTMRDRTQTFEQTEALASAYQELRLMHARLLSRSRLEAIGELAGSAAHALNNQLNVITLRLRRLSEKPEAAEDAAGIERSVREIAALVARLQEFAAVPQPHLPTALDAREVLEQALQMVRAELGPAGAVRLQAELQAVPPVLAERETLLEFLTALLLGARDVTPAGASVEVENRVEGDQVVLLVSDRGPTLSEEQVAQLFEPLAPGAADRAVSLSLGRQAVQRWGGEVRVAPGEGGGNVFEVRLPLHTEPAVAEAAEEEEEIAAPTAAVPLEVRRVLVVDDDADNASMLADLIRDAGAEAFTADTGGRALLEAAAQEPQAALVDLLLPDMRGWEVVQRLKERWPGIRVAVVSGLAVSREERESQAADAVFRKPIDTDELLQFLGL